MPKKILVATPDPVFGTWLRASLVESGEYEAHLAGNAGEMLRLASALPAALVLLDSELPGQPIPALVGVLAAARTPLVLIDSEGSPITATDENRLAKPFALADLLAVLHRLLPEKPAVRPPALWLDDPARGEQDLNSMLPDTGAQAALIVYDGALWTWAGGLDQTGAEEAAQFLPVFAKKPAQNKMGGLARYLRLEASGAEYLLYAIRLQEGLALALLFPPEMPLTLASTQTAQVGRALPLHEPPPEAAPVEPLAEEENLDEDDAVEEDDDNLTAAMEAELAGLLASMPSPDPDLHALSVVETWQAQPELDPLPVPVDQTADPVVEIPDWILPVVGANSGTNAAPRPSDTSPMRIATPTTASGKTGPLRVNGASPADSPVVGADVSYTCLLLPARPENTLTGDLYEHLNLWLPQLCLAFGWRLERLNIRPTHMQWSLWLPPSMSPGQIVRIVRQRTSERVFQQYPALAEGQPGADFWSPGYLAQRGLQPPSGKVLRDFIITTRRRQGYIVTE